MEAAQNKLSVLGIYMISQDLSLAYLMQTAIRRGWLNSLSATQVTLFPSAKGKGRKHRRNSTDRAVQSARKGSGTYRVPGIPLMNPEEPNLILR